MQDNTPSLSSSTPPVNGLAHSISSIIIIILTFIYDNKKYTQKHNKMKIYLLKEH